MKKWRICTCLPVFAAALLMGCGPDGDSPPTPTPSPTTPPPPSVLLFNFSSDATWTPGFSDFTPGMEPLVDFDAGLAAVPGLTGATGFLLGGNNPADDVALYAWRKIENLAPNAQYRVNAEVEFATNAPADCVGIGGAPGESVTFKIGAGSKEPALVLNGEGLATLNLDKANQTESGKGAVAIGNLASPQAGTCDAPVYARKTLSSEGKGPTVTSDADGALWLLLTTDSGFEGRTELYLLSARWELLQI